MSRASERYQLRSPGVHVPARVAAWFLRYASLGEYRGRDGEVDDVLDAMVTMAGLWRRSVTGTPRAPEPERGALSEWLTTAQAADLIGFTDRGIRKAIAEGRLDAINVDGRWRITREAFAHYRSGLRAK